MRLAGAIEKILSNVSSSASASPCRERADAARPKRMRIKEVLLNGVVESTTTGPHRQVDAEMEKACRCRRCPFPRRLRGGEEDAWGCPKLYPDVPGTGH